MLGATFRDDVGRQLERLLLLGTVLQSEQRRFQAPEVVPERILRHEVGGSLRPVLRRVRGLGTGDGAGASHNPTDDRAPAATRRIVFPGWDHVIISGSGCGALGARQHRWRTRVEDLPANHADWREFRDESRTFSAGSGSHAPVYSFRFFSSISPFSIRTTDCTIGHGGQENRTRSRM